jgi:hypothetical protein
MVYCVVPRELEAELYRQLTAYYADDPEVTVIVERRETARRRPGRPEDAPHRRELRDRRRRRTVGEFPRLYGEAAR